MTLFRVSYTKRGKRRMVDFYSHKSASLYADALRALVDFDNVRVKSYRTDSAIYLASL